MRIGLFGAGRIGSVHATSVSLHPRAELAWVCDPFGDAATKLAEQHGCLAFTDVDQALGIENVDAVLVCSATPTHVDLLTRAVQAGKAVMCEKPIDLDLARVDECWESISGLDPTVMVAFNRRFDPTFASIRQRVSDGGIGRLEQLIITSRDPEPPPAHYIPASGGIFRDMMIHDFDMARFFLGDVVEVQAIGANLISEGIKEAGDVDSAMVLLRGADGALCQITNSRRCTFGYDQRLEAFGSEAMLTAANQLPTTVRRSDATGTEVAAPYLNFFLDRYTPAYQAELDHFVTCVETGAKPSPSFADGRAALVLADAAGESMRTGARVRI
ncbi:MAG: inositol 2-dehydrogenase [Actinomycetales bacterium]